MPVAAFDALVLDAHLRQSLVAVRSLGRRGLAVAALETFPEAPAFASRWCQRALVCRATVGTDGYLAALESALDESGARVLIPSHDGTIALLRRHRERLERRARVALSAEPAMAIAVNKERTLAVARQLGIAVPPTVAVRSVAELPAALDEIGLPAVLKPDESWMADELDHLRLGPQLVTTAEEARGVVRTLARFGVAALVQPLLDGRREAVSFLQANGEIHARFAQWAKRTGPPLGGESLLRQSIAVPPDTGDQAERLVRAIGLEGYSEVEFRRDRAGVPHLMEVNPRLSASVEIAVRSGVDFPALLYQWATGQPIDRIHGYRTGGWMRHLGGDLMTTIATVRHRGQPGLTPPVEAVREFCTTFLRPMSYDYLDWRDPRPALKATAGFARHALKAAAGLILVGSTGTTP